MTLNLQISEEEEVGLSVSGNEPVDIIGNYLLPSSLSNMDPSMLDDDEDDDDEEDGEEDGRSGRLLIGGPEGDEEDDDEDEDEDDEEMVDMEPRVPVFTEEDSYVVCSLIPEKVRGWDLRQRVHLLTGNTGRASDTESSDQRGRRGWSISVR